jgi:NRPS condensation-like uncharacterized protein
MNKMVQKEKNSENNWHKLDNTGNLFPLISNTNFSNVFRVAAQLNETIDAGMLQQALNETLPWFSHFQFRIRHGFFWNYFEKNKQSQVLVEEEKVRPCSYIEPSKNQYFLFKVLYYQSRITLEVFHALTDGTGAVEFLKALVVNYLRLKKGEKIVIDSDLVQTLSDTEDGYKKYYKKQKINNKPNDKPIKSGFHVKGRILPMYEIGILHGYMDLEEILTVCKRRGVSLTVYLVAVYLWSIYKGQQLETRPHKPIQVAIPVNLRRFFDTNTTMNFFSYITAALLESSEEISFDHLVEHVKEQFHQQIDKEKFASKIGQGVTLQNNVLLRVMPLAIKIIFVKLVYMSSRKAYTSALSNLGQVTLPSAYVKDVKHFEFLLNPTALDPIKAAICSYDNKLVVTFTSQIVQTDVQKEFFRLLAKEGIEVLVESNGVYYENV